MKISKPTIAALALALALPLTQSSCNKPDDDAVDQKRSSDDDSNHDVYGCAACGMG